MSSKFFTLALKLNHVLIFKLKVGAVAGVPAKILRSWARTHDLRIRTEVVDHSVNWVPV